MPYKYSTKKEGEKPMRQVKAILILSILFSGLIGMGVVFAEVPLSAPGMVEGVGTHFELTSSKYLNITVESAESINLRLESIPEIVTMRIESTSVATSTVITLGGFVPQTTYYKYEDNYHNLEVFSTDENGRYSYTQDISIPHLVFILPGPGTKFISDNATGGDCTSIGTWDGGTKTCTLTGDVYETVQIDSSGVTLDGNGYRIRATGRHGVYISQKTGVTIKNLTVDFSAHGIYLYFSGYNTLTNNTASTNHDGIALWYSTGNTLTANTMTGNDYNFTMEGRLIESDYIQDIDTSNLVDGKPVYYLKNATGLTIDNSTNAGTVYCINCDGVTVRDLMLSHNGAGVFLWSTQNSRIENITASNNSTGIWLMYSNSNTITNNTASNNSRGIRIQYSNNNTLTSNTSSNMGIQLELQKSNSNTLSNNNLTNNTSSLVAAGLYMVDSSTNILRSNTTSNNDKNFVLFGGLDADYDNDIDASNLVDGKPIYYLKNVLGQTIDNSTNAGTVYCINCDGVTVRDLMLSHNGVGVFLWNTQNSRIENINTTNMYWGIRLDYSNGNTIAHNAPSQNGTGIRLFYSNNNNVMSNTLDLNSGIAIELYFASSNTLANNTGTCGWYGFGISLYASNDNTLTCNAITPNNVSGNPEGIRLYGSSHNVLTTNTVSGIERGITIANAPSYTASNNHIYNNNFINNTTQAHVFSGTDNIFNLAEPTGGNYWSNWITPDNDNDGFVDYPYIFTGGQDNLPLAQQKSCLPPGDTLPPTTSILLSGTSGNNGWFKSDVEVTLVATDNEGGSGVARTEYSFDGLNWNPYTAPFVVSTEGTTTVYYRSTDNAGNVEATKEVTTKIDKTSPSIVINAPVDEGAYVLNANILADWSATDSLSGLAEATGAVPGGVAIDTATAGIKTFSVTATDNAGNSSNKTLTYRVGYNKTDFLPPIKEAPQLSVFKSGRTVPAKFQLTDANGSCVSSAVANFKYQFLSDTAEGELVEGISTSAATTDSLFRYDPADCQYIFNWDTSGILPGKYNIYAILDDSTSITGQVGIRE